MVEIKEIRIGNVVEKKDSYRSVYEKFHTITEEEIYNEIGSSEVFKCFYPIPLTPEILEACGFKKHMFYPDAYRFRGGNLIKEEGGYVFRDNEGDVVDYTIKHLHQLQNLYFALTGSELEIKQLSQI